MTLDEAHKIANRLSFRAERIAPVRQAAEQAVLLSTDDPEVLAAANACSFVSVQLESLAAELVALLRQRRDQESERIEKAFEATAEGPRSEP